MDLSIKARESLKTQYASSEMVRKTERLFANLLDGKRNIDV